MRDVGGLAGLPPEATSDNNGFTLRRAARGLPPQAVKEIAVKGVGQPATQVLAMLEPSLELAVVNPVTLSGIGPFGC